jgi:NhaA family Na+:H+ antiporter
MATDVTFAAAAMALVVPMRSPARLFLLTLAVADDVGSILVIAIAYPRSVRVPWLAALSALLPILWVTREMWYPHRLARIGIAIATWIVFEASGVSPAMTGVCFAMFEVDDAESRRRRAGDITARGSSRPLRRMELAVAWGILPLFALVNSGVPVQTILSRATMTSPVFWGVALGFVIGKPIGIVLTGVLIRSRHMSRRIRLDLSAVNLLGVGAFGGVGFTVALFVNHLAFGGTSLEPIGRVAVLSGSLASGALGVIVLHSFRVRPATPAAPGVQPSS